MSFETVIKHTLKEEAGYANALADLGGETFRGISRVSHPNWTGWNYIDTIKSDLDSYLSTRNPHARAYWTVVDREANKNPQIGKLVLAYYKKEFYDRVAAFGFSDRVTDKLFDINVNISPKGSNKILQNAINSLGFGGPLLIVDGIIGQKTKEAGRYLCQTNETAFLRAICAAQKNHYDKQYEPGGALVGFPKAKPTFYARAAWMPA